MASWRDSDDPRCPACGEKITATASYCMHCEADFAPDGSVVEGSEGTVTDDFQREAGEDSDGRLRDESGPGRTTVDEDVTASDDVSYGTSADNDDTPRPGQDFEKTTLLLRGPIGVIMGLPAAILALFSAAFALDSVSGTVSGLVFLGTWVGVAAYLIRKPLASDAIGDGLYVYGAILVGAPVVVAPIRSLVILATGGNLDVVGTIVALVVSEMFLVIPATICFVLGYAFNAYARRRIEQSLDERRATV